MSFSFPLSTFRSTTSFVVTGKNCRILATAETLHKAMTDAYWFELLSEICEGKNTGVVVRYTGTHVAFIEFPSSNLSPSGEPYTVSASVPDDFLVPACPADNASFRLCRERTYSEIGTVTSGTVTNESDVASTSSDSKYLVKLCIVCGRYDAPRMVKRKKGWKCKKCKGTASHNRLIEEAKRMRAFFAL